MATPQDPSPTPAPESRLAQRQQMKLSDQVYEAVLTDIVQGRFPEGAKLPTETTLAQEFNVSRPVVREALARLRDDGLIQPRQGAGSFVLKRPGSALLRFAPIGSIADIQRCFEFRIAVEPMAAKLAATRRDDKELEKIKAALEALDEAIKLGTVDVASDFAFHNAVAHASRNAYFATTLHSLEQSVKTAMLLNRQLSLLNPLERLNLVQAEHRVVYKAILDRDGEAAFDAMYKHIEKARNRVFDGDAAV
ncbi:FadR/GntR family transcriptional regulator [Marivita cryptomonadis]|uniref:FadR/GntR family transcriptional regulator n=1 Tax=Marivita cryptomonadis TaxID=505252 RepID=UPI001C38B528|nr:FadR/GntR family transcriptional regulator [Marivita cryptomonadis]